MRSWQDVRNTIGYAFTDSLGRIRYCIPTADANRARWPTLGLWQRFDDMISNDLLQNRSGILPSNVIHANRIAKMREMDALLSGVFITRAAISGVSADGFDEFMENHIDALLRLIDEHSTLVEERIAKARRRYRLD